MPDLTTPARQGKRKATEKEQKEAQAKRFEQEARTGHSFKVCTQSRAKDCFSLGALGRLFAGGVVWLLGSLQSAGPPEPPKVLHSRTPGRGDERRLAVGTAAGSIAAGLCWNFAEI